MQQIQSPGLPYGPREPCPTQEPPQPSGLSYLKGWAQLEGTTTDPSNPWESRMVTLKGTLPSSCWEPCSHSPPGALEANLALSSGSPTRGLEFTVRAAAVGWIGGLLGPQAALGDSWGHRGDSLPRGGAGFLVRQPWLEVWPCHSLWDTWARCLS